MKILFLALVLAFPLLANPLDVYDDTTKIVTEQFYDRTFRGLPWDTLVSEHRARLSPASTDKELQQTLNTLLATLHASHTGFYTNHDQDYFALHNIFTWRLDSFSFFHIGAWFQKQDGKLFVRNVFAGGPCAQVLRPGDEIVAVDARSPEAVTSFNHAGTVAVTYRRQATGPTQTVRLCTRESSVQRALLDATRRSTKVFALGKKRVGYFHLWTGTHDDFRVALVNAVDQMKHTDAFILDLRDGFGGANPDFIEPFFTHYHKPVVTLINEGVRSGKEWIAYLLQKRKRSILVGTRTAGYFLGGKLFQVVPDKFGLYLAVEGNGPQGVDLEGKGVVPDIEVKSSLPYKSGADPQLAKALEVAEGN